MFPPVCLGCDREERPGPLPLGLCLPCRGRLKPVRGPVCNGCGEPLAAVGVPAGYLCAGCRRRPPAYDALLAGWWYLPPLEPVVRALKFGRLEFLGGQLAAALARRFGRRLEPVEAVAAVPLHWRRRLVRGYNQAEAIARPLAHRLGRPLVPALRRRRPTRPQTALARAERGRNVRGAFRTRRAARAAVRGSSLLLVDDVATTGATLDQAAAELLRAGASKVVALVAARTPPAEAGATGRAGFGAPPGPWEPRMAFSCRICPRPTVASADGQTIRG